MSNYPAGVTDNDPEFDMPSVEDAPNDEEERVISCSKCGRHASWDATYQDLCYRCIRADNE